MYEMDLIMYGNEVAKKSPYDGYYATRTGKVISVLTKDCKRGKKNFNCPHILKQHTNRTGYITVSIVKDGELKHVYLHKLMYETWVGPVGHDSSPNSETVIDHIDGDITNNNISNLRLITRKQNYYLSHGFGAKPFIMKKYKVFIDGVCEGIMSGYEMTFRYGVDSRARRNRVATRRMKLDDGSTIRWEFCV